MESHEDMVMNEDKDSHEDMVMNEETRKELHEEMVMNKDITREKRIVDRLRRKCKDLSLPRTPLHLLTPLAHSAIFDSDTLAGGR